MPKPDYWTSDLASLTDDPHLIGLVQDLAFCLLTKGGSHPRGKSTIVVPGVGISRAAHIFYDAIHDGYVDSDATLADVRDATMWTGLQSNGGSPTGLAVQCAWAAVGVGTATGCGRHDIVWRNNNGSVKVWRMNGGTIAAYYQPTDVGANPWQVRGTADFNGDGKNDLLWQNGTTREVKLWLMDSLAGITTAASVTYNGVVQAPTSDWVILGTGDFDGGGQDDILWRNTGSGEVKYWRMQGSKVIDTPTLGSEPSSAWVVQGYGNFDRTNDTSTQSDATDLVWRNTTTGAIRIWFANPLTNSMSNAPLTTQTLNWQVHGAGDFNGDGVSDILWRNLSNGEVKVWFLDGSRTPVVTALSATYGGVVWLPDASWLIKGVGDFDGDSKADILWRNTDNTTKLWLMNGNVIVSTPTPLTPSPGADWVIVGTGAFD